MKILTFLILLNSNSWGQFQYLCLYFFSTDNIYEARRRLIGSRDEVIKADIPKTYFAPATLVPSFLKSFTSKSEYIRSFCRNYTEHGESNVIKDLLSQLSCGKHNV